MRNVINVITDRKLVDNTASTIKFTLAGEYVDTGVSIKVLENYYGNTFTKTYTNKLNKLPVGKIGIIYGESKKQEKVMFLMLLMKEEM